MAKTNLLTFEACPESVVLDGFDDDALRGLGLFMVRVAGGAVGDAAYRVVTTSGGGRPRPSEDAAPRLRRPWRRHVRRGDEDLFVMPGCRVRLAAGRAEAVLEWTDTAAPVDDIVTVMLLETALIHALALGGYVVNHAAAFEVDGQALLAVGPSRAGKSTLSAAVLAAGGAVVSDDSVILGLDESGAPSAGALRRNLWLREGSVELLPEMMQARLVEAVSFGQPYWGVERSASPELFRTVVEPQAIVLLRRDLRVRGFTLRQVNSAVGLSGLIQASSPLFLSNRYSVERGRCMPALESLVNGVPCFEVRMGRALVEEPAATVGRLVGELCS